MENQAFQLLLAELKKLDGKIESNTKTQYQLNLLLQKQSGILEEHQRRSLANEELIGVVRKEAQEGIKALREESKTQMTEFKKELEPINKILSWLQSTWSFLKWASAFATILTILSVATIKFCPGVESWLHPKKVETVETPK